MQTPINFTKMHGLGNDFVIVDMRGRDGGELHQPAFTAQVREMSDRRTGIGCDQFIVLADPQNAQGQTIWGETTQRHTTQDAAAAAHMLILNSDGSLAEACGNAARCVVRLLMEDLQSDEIVLNTPAGRIAGHWQGNDVAVNMGPPGLLAIDIPLTKEVDPAALPIARDAPRCIGTGKIALYQPHAVSMGNPHMVFFVTHSELDALDLEATGPELSHHPLFPNGTNVEFVSVMPDGSLRLRVYERGAGVTQACGSGACAARVAAACRGLAPRCGPVELDGGQLNIDWQTQGEIIMSGPAEYSFSGVWDPR